MGLAWTGAVPYAAALAILVALVRTERLRSLEPGLALRQRLGIVLLATPIFTLLGVGLASVPSLGGASATAAASPDVLASKALVHLSLYLAVPAAGLVLTLGSRFPAVARRAAGLEGARSTARALATVTVLSGGLSALVVLAWTTTGGEGGLLAAEGASLFFSRTTPAVALALSAIAATAEELLFRGVALSWLEEKVPVAAAIGVQAVAFGLIHAGYGSAAHVAAATVFGVLMGVVAHRVGLAPAIGVHLLVNLVILGLWSGHPILLIAVAVLLAATALGARLLGPARSSPGSGSSPRASAGG